MLLCLKRHRSRLQLFRQSSTLRPSIPRIRRQTAFVDSPTAYLPIEANRVLFSQLTDKILDAPSHIPVSRVDQFNSLIHRIKTAADARNTEEIAAIWRELETQNFVAGLTPAVLRLISAPLAASLQTSNGTLELSTRVALVGADLRSHSLLAEVLFVQLRRGELETVFRLYADYARREEAESPEEEEDGEYQVEIRSDHRHVPAQVHLLLIALAACAAQNDFQHAVKLCLASRTEFHHYSTNEFFTRLAAFNTVLQQKVESFIPKLDVIRQLSRPLQLCKHISNLSRTKASVTLEQLYISVTRAISEGYIAADPSFITPSTSASVTQHVWTSFLTAFLKTKRNDLAEGLWDDMLRFNVPTGSSLWSALIDGQVDQGAFLAAVSTWDSMLSSGIPPDAWTYRAYIEALFRARRRSEALHAFDKFQTEVSPKSSTDLQLVVYNTVLQGLLHTHSASQALQLLQAMIDNGPFPDVVSFNTFLAFYLQRGNIQGSASIFNKMTEANVQGDEMTFSTLLSTLVRIGRTDAVDTILNLMKKQGVQSNVVTFTTLIKQYARTGRSEHGFISAMKLLQRMEADPDMQPNAVTYTTMLAGLAQFDLTPTQALASLRFLVNRMKERGIGLDSRAYKIIIKTALRVEGREGLDTALEYYREMVNSKICMDSTTWYILLVGLQARREWIYATQIIGELVASGVEPSAALRDLVRRIHEQASRGRNKPNG